MTARLSKTFYDKVGEQAANELVEWFNAVDATYRADLRELNELNFARFEAKLVEFRAGIDAKIDSGFAAQDAKLERRLGEHMRFMYLAWAAQMAAIVGFGTAILSFIR